MRSDRSSSRDPVWTDQTLDRMNECLGSDDPDCCIADLNIDGVIGVIDQLLMWSAMVEFVPVTAVR